MKNSFKIGIVILAIAITAMSCDPVKTNSGKPSADSLKTVADTTAKAGADTAENH